jgi:hypothetical protein
MPHDKTTSMNFNLNIEDNLRIEDDLNIKTKIFFSKSYIESSMIFSRNAKVVESKESHDYFDKSNHHANVVGSILFSVLYLESTINEFYINIADRFNFGPDIKPINKEKIVKFWSTDKGSSYSILEKYQSALTFMECDKFIESKNPFQNVKILISLRNYLVHYKPEWGEVKENENDSVELANLQKKLVGKFQIRNISGLENEYFPNKYLSYGCTNWVISNSIQFVNDFYENLGIEYIYKDIIKELKINYGA